MAMRGSVVQEDAGGNAQVGRRSLLKGVAAVFSGAASISAMPSFASAMPTTDTEKATGQRPLRASSTDAIVSTDAGKVAGYVRNGISTFKGIPYGDTTAGTNRFLPPAKPKPWTGVRSSRQFGHVSPQGPRARAGPTMKRPSCFRGTTESKARTACA